MYSVILMMALSGASETPQGILFNRGGCSGQQAGVFAGRERRFHIFPIFHRRSGGCGGGQAAVIVGYGGCSGGTVQVQVQNPFGEGPAYGRRRMDLVNPPAVAPEPGTVPAPVPETKKPEAKKTSRSAAPATIVVVQPALNQKRPHYVRLP